MSTNMKNVIADTFFRMVQERGIDRITVKDLVESCHISRQTFYYHFQDILDVVEWSAKKGVERALAVSLAIADPKESIRQFVEAGIQSHEIIQKLLQSQKREYIEKIFVEALQSYLVESVRRRASSWTASREDTAVALQFYSYGIAGVLLEQCGREGCDPERLAQQLLRLLQGELFQSLSGS